MAATTTSTSEEKDWRDDCVAPKKDTRVQTLVIFVPCEHSFLPSFEGRHCHKGTRI